jgi:hypothetical protein
MKKSVVATVWCCLLACCSVVPLFSSAQTVADKRSILRQARQAYYNLRSEGLLSFQCSTTPNWEKLLEDIRKQDPAAADNAVKILSQLHFVTTLGADGKVTIAHNDLPGQSKEMMDALHQVYGGMEQMTSGFFDTWSLFMLNSPLPEVSSEYQLEAMGPQYRLTYKEGTSDIVTTMGRDFAISNLKVTTPEFDSSLQPGFIKTPKGLVLSAYDASNQSQKPEETTQLRVLMDYQQVDGLQMLQKLNLSGTYGGSKFAVELIFSGCQVTKKAAGN